MGQAVMEYHYNAFISYNHNDRDMRVAENIHKKLEHYRFPKGVKSSRGIKKIERIFRDKGELEVANDLNDIIMNALDHTDCLIVICSPESKASIWVQKEVTYFLEKHSRRDVLTVLTAGDPLEVIPDQLLFEEKEVTGDDGEIKTVRRSLEPLSCDYRGDMRKADREELPRLAATLFGCRYDDLVQRQRHYRMRQLISFSLLVTGLLTLALSYFIWSNHRIRTNYSKALVNESRYLTNEAREAMKTGDRQEAIRLLLDALPDQDDPDAQKRSRPLYPDALLELSDALHLYRSGAQKTGPFDLEVESVVRNHVYQNGHLFTDSEKKYIFEVEDKQIYVRRAGSDDLICKMHFDDNNLVDMYSDKILPDHRILVCQNHRIMLYDYLSGKQIWSMPVANTIYSAKCDGGDRPVLYLAADDLILSVDTSAGKILKRQKLQISSDENRKEKVEKILALDEVRGYVFYSTSRETDNMGYLYQIKSVNIETGKSNVIEDNLNSRPVAALAFTKDKGNPAFLIYSTMFIDAAEEKQTVKAYDPVKEKTVWTEKYAYSYTAYSHNSGLAYVYTLGTDKEDTESYVILPGYVYTLDPENGHVKTTFSIESNAFLIERDKKNTTVINTLGDVYSRANGEKEYNLFRSVFPANLQSAVSTVAGDETIYYCLTTNGLIKKYSRPGRDASYRILGQDPDSNYTKNIVCGPGWTVVQGNKDLFLVNEKKHSMQRIPVEKIFSDPEKYSEAKGYKHEPSLLEVDGDRLYYMDYIMQNYDPCMFTVNCMDLKTGKISLEREIPFQFEEGFYKDLNTQYAEGSSTVYFSCCVTNNTTIVFSYNIKTGKSKRVILDTRRAMDVSYSDISPDGKHMVFYSDTNLELCIFDLDDGSMSGRIDLSSYDREMLDSNFSRYHMNAYALSDKYLALADGKMINVYDHRGKRQCRISYEDYKSEEEPDIRLALSPDANYVYFFTGQTFGRCLIASGRIVNKVAMPEEVSESSSYTNRWLYPDRGASDDHDEGVFIVNGDDLYEVSFNEDLSGIIMHIDSILSLNLFERSFTMEYIQDSNTIIQSHEIYTPEEIIALGKEELSND
ncbi:MAG: TIR domain-containing protein [Eubacterium sp.]|nr:TIR domain-containing protein [Eubacterium sp.]